MWPSTLITPRDLLAPAGEPVRLEVEAERRFWTFFDPARSGVQVEATGGAKGTTDAAGEALLDLGALAPGLHRVEVRALGESAEARVAVIAKDAPVFITDIDHTIADVSPAGFIFKPVGSVRPLEGAAEVLERISRSMQLVYLTARDHVFRRKTRAWLELHRFPDAPLYLRRRTRFWSVSAAEHKRIRVGELRQRFAGLRWGVGDTPGDIRAYAEHGLRPILIGPSLPPALPPETVHLRSWTEIAAKVLA